MKDLNTQANLTHDEYVFILAILDRTIANWNDNKYKRLKLGAVKHVASVLETIGFHREGEEFLSLPDSIGPEKIQEALRWCQEKVDETINPETITFSQIADILRREGKLPNIRDDIDDVPLSDKLDISEDSRPLKPWEVS